MNTDAPDESKGVHFVLKQLPPAIRGHVVAVLGEFVGTTSFIFFAFAGTQTANIASNVNTGTTVITTVQQKNPAQLLYISLSFGFSLAVNAWVFFRISGGLFNPAVTIGMVLIGAISLLRGILLFVTQIVGAIVGAFMVKGLFTGDLNLDTTLHPTTTIAQGVLIEMLLTTLLVFTIFMLAAEKHTGNFIAPIGIGLALFISELVGVFWTGGSLNPARSLAPAVASYTFHSTQWVYWVGPISGAILAVLIFKVIKGLEYETANPDPESASPTGPAPVKYKPQGPTGADLEAGYSNTSEKDKDVGHFLDNRHESGSSSHVDREIRLNPVARSAPANNNYTPTPTELPARGTMPAQTVPQQRYAEQNVAPGQDARWNAVHTANARANTHAV